MKVLVFILSVLVSTALIAGGMLLTILMAPHNSVGLLLLTSFALTVLIYGPLTLGSLTAYWDVARNAGSRAFFKRWLWVVTGLEALGGVAIIVFSALARAPVWLPILFILGGLVLTAAALWLGRMLRRHDEAHPRPVEEWAPVTATEVRRKVAIIAVTFVIVFAVGIVFFGLLGTGSGRGLWAIARPLVFALNFAFIAAALASIIVTVPLSRRLRETVNRDLGTIRKVAKVVVRHKKLDLDAGEQASAAKYATIVPTLFAFNLSYVVLLYIGLGLNQVQLLASGDGSGFSVGLLIALAVVLAAFVPYYVVIIRRARAYARAHGDLLPDAPTRE